MSEMNTEIDAALAQEKLDKVLEALHSAPATIVGLQTSTIVSVAGIDAISQVLVRNGMCGEDELLNLITENITTRLEEMVDAGILPEETLSFQTTDEDDAIDAV